MYRKRELVIGGILILMICSLVLFFREPEKSSSLDASENRNYKEIQVEIIGEVAKETTIIFQSPLTYGALFLKTQIIWNEYSDLSGFDVYEKIDTSRTIVIPTLDTYSVVTAESLTTKININNASKKELMDLDQIGDKRSDKILEYIAKNGRISSWENLWSIASVPDKAKEPIMQKATL